MSKRRRGRRGRAPTAAPGAAKLLPARWYINGFPKSGTHLIARMIEPLANRMPRGMTDKSAWISSFYDHAWTTKWKDSEIVLFRLARLRPGYFFIGHCGYKSEIERFLWFSGICHVFIYRDFRDVAVSQAFHVIGPDDKYSHSDKEFYRSLESFDDVLSAVIVGTDKWPGVMERWQHYAGWLKQNWVFRVPFEDARTNPAKIAKALVAYSQKRMQNLLGIPGKLASPGMIEKMVKSGEQRSKSATFRKGLIGGWRDHFTERHKAEFKASDVDGWLVRLGYEENDNW